jgi:hypothetical protein
MEERVRSPDSGDDSRSADRFDWVEPAVRRCFPKE